MREERFRRSFSSFLSHQTELQLLFIMRRLRRRARHAPGDSRRLWSLLPLVQSFNLEKGGCPMIRFERVEKRYGAVHALRGIDLTVREGEFAVLIGPSGCGKTTALKMVNRLLSPTQGRVL